jgi:hypothetical protein
MNYLLSLLITFIKKRKSYQKYSFLVFTFTFWAFFADSRETFIEIPWQLVIFHWRIEQNDQNYLIKWSNSARFSSIPLQINLVDNQSKMADLISTRFCMMISIDSTQSGLVSCFLLYKRQTFLVFPSKMHCLTLMTLISL